MLSLKECSVFNLLLCLGHQTALRLFSPDSEKGAKITAVVAFYNLEDTKKELKRLSPLLQHIETTCCWEKRWTWIPPDGLNSGWPEKRDKRCVCSFIIVELVEKIKSTSDGFPLKTEGWTKTSFKDNTLSSKRYKNMFAAVQGVSWSKGKIKCHIFLLPVRMLRPGKKKEKKVWPKKIKNLISLSLWKNRRSLLFWEQISHKNTLKTKQNWQRWIYRPALFCLRPPLFAPLPWKQQGYLSLRPFLQ